MKKILFDPYYLANEGKFVAFVPIDSLLAIVQMPSRVPVATVAIGKAGAKNVGILGALILDIKFPETREKAKAYKREIAKAVEEKGKEFECNK